jgi:hypothetical protein
MRQQPRETAIDDPSAEFFDRLNRAGYEAGLAGVRGTIRCDLEREHRSEHWLLTIDNGDVRVSPGWAEADCVVQADHAVFDGMVTGEVKPKPAWLRNDVLVAGRFLYFLRLEKLLARAAAAQPGPGPGDVRRRT